MNILLDTGILGAICHPKNDQNQEVAKWLESLLLRAGNFTVFLPEIADYELRRKLLHLIRQGQGSEKSVRRLDELGALLEYLPLKTRTMKKAAELWADARSKGFSSAPARALDGDVILAAQTLDVDGTVVTSNIKHLSQYVPAKDWRDIIPSI